jgi:hypothetical protein
MYKLTQTTRVKKKKVKSIFNIFLLGKKPIPIDIVLKNIK